MPAEKMPRAFGRYELLERLAVGGMAELFKARVPGAHGFEKTIVIKRILPHLAADKAFVDMFIDEAKITARLDHPKIAQVLELGNVDAQLYIAMELVDGFDVLAVLRGCAKLRQPLPPHLAVHITAEVLDALGYAHGALDAQGKPLGIVHRDISPSNVLVSRRGDVKLTDFGIAHAAERQQTTRAGTLKGKYGYMSPEQVAGAPLDGRSDLFSVGILMAEMLMGRRLFTSPNDLDVLLMVRDVELARLDKYGASIDAGLRQILDEALVRDPAGRFEGALEFRDALTNWLFDQRQRVGARDLASFIEFLFGKEALKASRASSEDGVDRGAHGTLTGPTTQRKQLAAEAAALRARERLSEESPGGVTGSDISKESPVENATQAPGPIMDAEAEADAQVLIPDETPDELGDFAKTSPVRALFTLAVNKETGLLVCEISAIVKEIWIAGGIPQFVSSNVARELLGEYLVANKVITQGELAMALAMMPHFGGKLGDTLVGLGLMKPLEVFRLLSLQVRAKIIDVCTWQKGVFRFYRGKRNPREAFPLGLDAFEIIGAGATSSSQEVIDHWLKENAEKIPMAVDSPRVVPEAFRLGGYPRLVSEQLDGSATVKSLVRRITSTDERLAYLRTLYLLVETGLASL